MNSIRHTLQAQILSRMTVDESAPVVEPAPILELDSDLLKAFYEQPEPKEIDLGPLVVPYKSDSYRIRVENCMDVTVRCFTNGTIIQVVTNSLSPLSGQNMYDGSRATV